MSKNDLDSGIHGCQVRSGLIHHVYIRSLIRVLFFFSLRSKVFHTKDIEKKVSASASLMGLHVNRGRFHLSYSGLLKHSWQEKIEISNVLLATLHWFQNHFSRKSHWRPSELIQDTCQIILLLFWCRVRMQKGNTFISRYSLIQYANQKCPCLKTDNVLFFLWLFLTWDLL